MTLGRTNLARVHLELAHHLDGDLAVLAVVVACFVDVAEGAVAHLFNQRPALQAGIFGQLALGFTLFCHDALQHGGVDVPVLGLLLLLLLLLVLVLGGAGCHVSGLGGDVAVVDGADGVVAVGCNLVLLGVLVHDGLADANMTGLWVVIMPLRLVLCVYVGHVGGGLAVRGVCPGLLAMAQEVLEVLYCGHLSRVRPFGRCVRNFGWGEGGVGAQRSAVERKLRRRHKGSLGAVGRWGCGQVGRWRLGTAERDEKDRLGRPERSCSVRDGAGGWQNKVRSTLLRHE